MTKMPSPRFCFVALFFAGRVAQIAASSTHIHHHFKLERNGGSQTAKSDGSMRMMILRILADNGNAPESDTNKLSDIFFGTHENTLHSSKYDSSTWYDSCSGGKHKFKPAVGPNVIDGVLEINIEVDESADSPWGNRCEDTVFHQYIEKFEEYNKKLKIEYESLGFIPPHSVCNPGGGGLGGGKNHIYFTGTEKYLELVIHEIGHTLGLTHSRAINSDGSIDEYGDHSCMMGCCAGAQQMCFNAPKSWELGWYSEEGKEGFRTLLMPSFLSSFDKSGLFWKTTLVGIDDYLNGLFDETQHKVIVQVADFFISFNRAKGVTYGTKAYSDKVVIYEQEGRRGKSLVKGVIDDRNENSILVLPNFTSQNYDLVMKVCDIKIQYLKLILSHKPSEKDDTDANITIVAVGTASQSHSYSDWNEQNLYGAASNAVDGDKTSFSHTTGSPPDQWWKWTFDTPTVVQKIIVTNISHRDTRMDNAVVELLDENELPLASRNLGIDIDIITIDFDVPYTVKTVKIETPGSHLVIKDVEIWGGKPLEPLPDYASVITFISEEGNSNSFSCDTTPSVIPDGLQLIRNSEECVEEDATDFDPRRFRCSIQPTFEVTNPWSYGNPGLLLYTRKHKDWGCAIVLQPIHWSWGGNSLYFESKESLQYINDCFRPGSVLTETISWSTETTIPDNIELLRSDDACVFQAANPGWGTPDRFYCPIEKTSQNGAPTGYDSPSIIIYGDDCGIELRPVHWSISGTQFYFTSTEDLENVNTCFTPGVLLTEFPVLNLRSATPSMSSFPSQLPTVSNEPTKSSAPSRPINLALLKLTEQDSTSSGGVASRAVDGNTNGVYSGNSVTHTENGSNRFWMVDLEDDAVISEIILYNRVDCCSYRLNHFKLEILDVEENVVDSKFFTTNDGSTFSKKEFIFPEVKGRKVRIAMKNGIISLAEVEVYGYPAKVTSSPTPSPSLPISMPTTSPTSIPTTADPTDAPSMSPTKTPTSMSPTPDSECIDTAFMYDGKKTCAKLLGGKSGKVIKKKCKKWDKYGRLVKNHCPKTCRYSCDNRCADDESFVIKHDNTEYRCDDIPNSVITCTTLFMESKKQLVAEHCRKSCGICS